MSDERTIPNESALTNASGRFVGADITRILACFLVMSIHFLLNIKFYDAPISGVNMYIMLVMRMFFSVCVPLFIILTGYLMVTKPLSFSHYAKGMRVVWIYLLACTACIIYKLYIRKMGTWDTNLQDIFRYRAAPYAWYIEMYFGLYLMIPFLNLIYRHLPSKKWKTVLVITVFALNTLPKFINSFNFTEPGWWLNPTLSTTYQRIVPQWWNINSYPISYYFIGAYLREYGLRINGILHRVLIIVTLGLSTLYQYWRSGGGSFSWGINSDWDALPTAILSILVFALLLRKDYSRIPQKLRSVLKYISGLTLLMFLVSYIFDEEFYKILNERILSIPDRLPAYFIAVPAVFFASMALAAVLDLIYRLLRLICLVIKSRILSLRRIGTPADTGTEAEVESAEPIIHDIDDPDFSPREITEGDEQDA